MWEAIYHWILWRRFTLLSLCLRHVISRVSTPLTFLLSHTFREVNSRDVRIVCPRPKTHPSLLHYVIPYSLLRPSPRPCVTHRIIPISYEQFLPQSYSPSWCATYCRLPDKAYSNFWSSDALVLSQRESKTGKLNPTSSSLIHKIYDSNFLKLLQTERWKTNESFLPITW